MVQEHPTEKQYKYAQAISEELGIEMPFEYSKKAYSDYISHYQSEYKMSLQSYHLEEEDD